MKKLWHEPSKPAATWHAWLGDAVAIKDPTSAVFRKQSGSNVLILGQQEEIAELFQDVSTPQEQERP